MNHFSLFSLIYKTNSRLQWLVLERWYNCGGGAAWRGSRRHVAQLIDDRPLPTWANFDVLSSSIMSLLPELICIWLIPLWLVSPKTNNYIFKKINFVLKVVARFERWPWQRHDLCEPVPTPLLGPPSWLRLVTFFGILCFHMILRCFRAIIIHFVWLTLISLRS